jgi:hypothetical protein
MASTRVLRTYYTDLCVLVNEMVHIAAAVSAVTVVEGGR